MYFPGSLYSKYSEEIFGFDDIYHQERDIISRHITVTHKMDQYSVKGGKFRDTILHKTGIKEKIGNFIKHVKDYSKKLDEHYSKIAKATSMNEADKIADSVKIFHDISTKNLYTESKQILEDFQVTIAGLTPDEG